MKKLFTLILVGVLTLGVFTACANTGDSPSSTTGADDASSGGEAKKTVITIGASPTPHAEILKVAAEVLAEQNIELDIKEFTDYVQPNIALNDGSLDANFFQHKPYLDNFCKERSLNLVSAGAIHYEPFGLFPGRTKSLEELKDGAIVAVPNDATNEARALLLLQENGLIKLKEGAGLEATAKDIAENPKNLQIKEIAAEQLSRSLPDVDIAAINGNYALQVGLSANKDAFAIEGKDSDAVQTYANVIAVRAGDEDRPEIKALCEALKSQKVKDFIAEKYQGGVVTVE